MNLHLSLLQDLLLGKDARLRLRMKRSALAALLYGVCLLAHWQSVRLALVTVGDAEALTIFCLGGVTLFLVAIRSGFSARFADAALTMPQMVFAIVCLALAYIANPSSRASVTVVVPLVLVYGAFILPSRRCVQLGCFAVAVFGVTMAYGVWSQPQVFVPGVEAQAFTVTAMVFSALAYLAGQLSQLRIDQKEQRNQLRDAMEEVRRMATRDPLTGLPNRRHVDEGIGGLILGTRRRGLPLSVAILDLDRFKRINDLFGHAAGDEVLRVFAREASALLRESDVLARWGGEEFLLVLPATGIDDACEIVERMRTRVASSASWAAYPHPRVTFSAGLAVLGDRQTLQQALQCADFALYEAKNQGRDRTVVAASECGSVTTPPAPRPRIADLSSVY